MELKMPIPTQLIQLREVALELGDTAALDLSNQRHAEALWSLISQQQPGDVLRTTNANDQKRACADHQKLLASSHP
jgi:hypothetical protein